jgi:hypothetical protein
MLSESMPMTLAGWPIANLFMLSAPEDCFDVDLLAHH